MTTSCSSKRKGARGSASSTAVSGTYTLVPGPPSECAATDRARRRSVTEQPFSGGVPTGPFVPRPPLAVVDPPLRGAARAGLAGHVEGALDDHVASRRTRHRQLFRH